MLDQQLALPEGSAVELLILPPQAAVAPASKNGVNLPTLAERLKDFIHILEDVAEDAARNHDHYIDGTPKQQ